MEWNSFHSIMMLLVSDGIEGIECYHTDMSWSTFWSLLLDPPVCRKSYIFSTRNNHQRLANDLNELYCRFDRQRDSPVTIPHDTSKPLQLHITSSSPTSAGAWAPLPIPTLKALPSTHLSDDSFHTWERRQQTLQETEPPESCWTRFCLSIHLEALCWSAVSSVHSHF